MDDAIKGMAEAAEDYLRSYKEYKPEVAKKPEPHKRWRAEHGEDYWTISENGRIEFTKEWGWGMDDHRYNAGNYFKTREETDNYREVQLATQRLKDAAEGFEPDWNDSEQEKWVPSYDKADDGYFAGLVHYYPILNTIYYASEERAQWVIDNMRDDLGLVMGIKDE